MRHWFRSHRAFRIQQMVVARSQPQADQCARIRHCLRLPAVIGLIAAHGVFAGLVPVSGRFAAQVMLANQRFLNLLHPLGINLLLAPRSRFSLAAPPRARALRAALVGGWGIRFCLRLNRVAACLRSSRTGGIRRLGKRCAWRCARTEQRQSAACTQPTPHSRATLLHASQRQTSELRTRLAALVEKMTHQKTKRPNWNWHSNHPPLQEAMPVPVGPVSGYGSVPAMKMVPS